MELHPATETQARLERLKSFYSVLSAINHLIVRVRDPQRLFVEACRVAVEMGSFRMAWIGKSNPETQCVDVVAFSGVVDDYLDKINIDLKDPARSSGPTGQAVLTGRHVLSNDIENDATMGPWKADARKMRIRSSGAFPIRLAGSVWGAFTLYSEDKAFFDDQVIRLLDELSMDIGFALEVSAQEAALKVRSAQLVQSQKMESLGTLASGIAHNFNNLLGIVSGQVSLLEVVPPDAKRLQKSLSAIKQAVTRGATLVRQLMTFARKSEPLFEAVRLNDLVAEAMRLLEETFPKTITLVLNLDPVFPAMGADSSQLHQLLLNLCLNARDAMPDGGTLTVTTALKSDVQPPLGLLKVSDTGIGMDAETKRNIFEPFFTTKEKGKGTGLGLSMVFGIVESHHGRIEVESEPGRGTTFECQFPLLGAAAYLPFADPAVSASPQWEGGTVLVAEDEPLLRDALAEFLASNGIPVEVAADGQAAVEVFRLQKDQISVIVTDLGLPKLGGWELISRFRELDPSVRLLAVSGDIDSVHRKELLRDGSFEFLSKPYDMEDLLAVVLRLAAR